MHLEDHTLPCVWYHHGEIDEVVPDSIARADSYWRIEVPGNGDPADFHTTVDLEDHTLPRLLYHHGEIDEVELDSIARADVTFFVLLVALVLAMITRTRY